MKYKKLYHHCFVAKDLKDNDLLPVMQDVGTDHKINLNGEKRSVLLDFKNLDIHVDNILKLKENIPLESLEKWLKENKYQVEPDLFRTLVAFSQYTQKKLFFGKSFEILNQRTETYNTKKVVPLSETFNQKISLCAERASFTQYFLQKAGISSVYLNGYMNKTDKTLEEHSFIYLDAGFIFDPQNPINKNAENPMPSLFSCPKKQWEIFKEKNTQQATMLSVKNILSKEEELYGVSSSKYKAVDKPFIIENPNRVLKNSTENIYQFTQNKNDLFKKDDCENV